MGQVKGLQAVTLRVKEVVNGGATDLIAARVKVLNLGFVLRNRVEDMLETEILKLIKADIKVRKLVVIIQGLCETLEARSSQFVVLDAEFGQGSHIYEQSFHFLA